jgi:DNA-binding GntR family transcriptional regulator
MPSTFEKLLENHRVQRSWPFAPAETSSKTLTGQADSMLRQAIIAGYLRPGERLTMRGLAEDMGMSVTPVREAIQNLIAEHVLFMKSPKTIIMPRVDKDACYEVFQIRVALETLAAVQAMPNLGEQDFQHLRSVNARHREALKNRDIGNVLKTNNAFHFSIYRPSRMPTLLSLIENQWLRIGPTLNLLHPDYVGGLSGNDDHEMIIQALEAGSAAELSKAITDALLSAQDEIMKRLPSRLTD